MDQYQAHLLISNSDYLCRVTDILNENQTNATQFAHQTFDQFINLHKSQAGQAKQILCTDNLQIPQMLRSRGLFVPIVVLGSEGQISSSLSCISAGETDESISDAFSSVMRIAEQLQKLKASARKLATLAERERRIINLAAEGVPNKAIATHLGVSIKTVEKNRRNAYHKLSVSSTAEMASLVTFNRFFDPILGNTSPFSRF